MSCCFRLPKRKTAQQLALSSANTFLRSSGVEKRKRSSSTITKSDIVVIGSDAAFRIDPARLRELASVEPRREEKEENQQEEEEKVCVTGVVEGPLNIIEEDEEEEGGRGSVGSFGNRGSVSGRTRETEGIQRRARGEASPYLRKKTSQVNLTILDGLLKGSLEVVKTFASTAMQTDGDESGVKDGEGGEKCGSVDSVFPESAVDATPMAKEILGRAKSMNARRGSVGESRRASLAAGQDKDDKIAAVMKLDDEVKMERMDDGAQEDDERPKCEETEPSKPSNTLMEMPHDSLQQHDPVIPAHIQRDITSNEDAQSHIPATLNSESMLATKAELKTVAGSGVTTASYESMKAVGSAQLNEDSGPLLNEKLESIPLGNEANDESGVERKEENQTELVDNAIEVSAQLVELVQLSAVPVPLLNEKAVSMTPSFNAEIVERGLERRVEGEVGTIDNLIGESAQLVGLVQSNADSVHVLNEKVESTPLLNQKNGDSGLERKMEDKVETKDNAIGESAQLVELNEKVESTPLLIEENGDSGLQRKREDKVETKDNVIEESAQLVELLQINADTMPSSDEQMRAMNQSFKEEYGEISREPTVEDEVEMEDGAVEESAHLVGLIQLSADILIEKVDSTPPLNEGNGKSTLEPNVEDEVETKDSATQESSAQEVKESTASVEIFVAESASSNASPSIPTSHLPVQPISQPKTSTFTSLLTTQTSLPSDDIIDNDPTPKASALLINRTQPINVAQVVNHYEKLAVTLSTTTLNEKPAEVARRWSVATAGGRRESMGGRDGERQEETGVLVSVVEDEGGVSELSAAAKLGEQLAIMLAASSAPAPVEEVGSASKLAPKAAAYLASLSSSQRLRSSDSIASSRRGSNASSCLQIAALDPTQGDIRVDAETSEAQGRTMQDHSQPHAQVDAFVLPPKRERVKRHVELELDVESQAAMFVYAGMAGNRFERDVKEETSLRIMGTSEEVQTTFIERPQYKGGDESHSLEAGNDSLRAESRDLVKVDASSHAEAIGEAQGIKTASIVIAEEVCSQNSQQVLIQSVRQSQKSEDAPKPVDNSDTCVYQSTEHELIELPKLASTFLSESPKPEDAVVTGKLDALGLPPSEDVRTENSENVGPSVSQTSENEPKEFLKTANVSISEELELKEASISETMGASGPEALEDEPLIYSENACAIVSQTSEYESKDFVLSKVGTLEALKSEDNKKEYRANEQIDSQSVDVSVPLTSEDEPKECLAFEKASTFSSSLSGNALNVTNDSDKMEVSSCLPSNDEIQDSIASGQVDASESRSSEDKPKESIESKKADAFSADTEDALKNSIDFEKQDSSTQRKYASLQISSGSTEIKVTTPNNYTDTNVERQVDLPPVLLHTSAFESSIQNSDDRSLSGSAEGLAYPPSDIDHGSVSDINAMSIPSLLSMSMASLSSSKSHGSTNLVAVERPKLGTHLTVATTSVLPQKQPLDEATPTRSRSTSSKPETRSRAPSHTATSPSSLPVRQKSRQGTAIPTPIQEHKDTPTLTKVPEQRPSRPSVTRTKKPSETSIDAAKQPASHVSSDTRHSVSAKPTTSDNPRASTTTKSAPGTPRTSRSTRLSVTASSALLADMLLSRIQNLEVEIRAQEVVIVNLMREVKRLMGKKVPTTTKKLDTGAKNRNVAGRRGSTEMVVKTGKRMNSSGRGAGGKSKSPTGSSYSITAVEPRRLRIVNHSNSRRRTSTGDVTYDGQNIGSLSAFSFESVVSDRQLILA